VHLVVSPAGAQVVADELGRQVRLDDFRLDDLLGEQGRASDAAGRPARTSLGRVG